MESRPTDRSKAIAKFLPAFVIATAIGGLLLSLIALPVVGGLGLGAKSVAQDFEKRPSDFELPPVALQNRILDTNGRVIATFFSQNRIYVPLAKINPVMKEAIIAIEDARFYEHGALDTHGTLRAIVANLQEGDTVQGASSITQQLVKNVQIQRAGDDKDAIAEAQALTVERKLQELRYAVDLEQRYTKDQILEAYLNIAYFGSGTYGVQAAARYYFNTTADKLNLEQSALLAGIVKNPWRFDPTNGDTSSKKKQFRRAALDRRNTVLDRMTELKLLAPQVAAAAKKKRIKLHIHRTPNGCYSSQVTAAVFCQYVQKLLLSNSAFGRTADERGALVNNGGLTIRTTLDLKAQRGAEKAIEKRVYASDDTAAALVMVQPGSGAIRAMAQSKKLGLVNTKSQTDLNLAVDQEYGGGSGWQPGSAMKPFTTAAALVKGIRGNHTLNAPYHLSTRTLNVEHNCQGGRVFPDWEAGYSSNENPQENGRYTLADALADSVNNYFIRLTDEVGLCNVVRMAERLGVHRADIYSKAQSKDPKIKEQAKEDGLKIGQHWPLREVYSFTLGANEVSPLTMASAYATFAARGIYCQPYAISSVLDRNGKKLPVPKHDCKRELSTNIADAMNALLKGVITHGTAANSPLANGREAAGKTGTTNDKAHGVWFIGFTPQLSTAVATGDPHCSGGPRCSLNGRMIGGQYYRTVFGATLPAPIWKDAMDRALDGKPFMHFHGAKSKYIFGERVTVPDVSGQTISSATSDLKSMGLKVDVSGKRVSSSEREGRVAYTSPSAGSRVRAGSTITLRISSGGSSRSQDSTPSGGGGGGGGDGGGHGNGNGSGGGGGGLVARIEDLLA
jgi:membrane peptidoglycan carboxypeptidase